MNFEIIEKLINIIKDRKTNPKEGSYTNTLLSAGENKIIKKLGEEFAEFLKAYLTEPEDRVVSEFADLFYHFLVAFEYKDIDFANVLKELESRHK
ncbi:phosphoribosyl-ATP diphosphatase [Deferribacter autotrophicus]|uniref:Phosphoribosyl-ATP pyrophosphatase n=1 Tax=Deferribacter autotrophicus TaxID=500465 RepID=A0A5A8F444_9BACT|nr:phosphoribosyl-ATP diphosphatase [Deferribacter autotrophicus]KAA0258658.1 phosphoribosyl-ATP diphosphatase [Deferribacter autotrophicus]